MSATLTDINERRLNDTEKLLAASSSIVKLETANARLGTAISLLGMTLTSAIMSLEALSVSLAAEPFAFPKTAESLVRTVALLREHQAKAEEFSKAASP